MFSAFLMLLTSTASPQPRCQSGFAAASEQLRLADHSVTRRDFPAANRALDAALDKLGHAYAPGGMLDDSGMHLVVASQQERRGKLKDAVEIKRRILTDRMAMCTTHSRPMPSRPPRP